MNADAWLTIGKITGVHGLGGNLKVWSFADSPDTFAGGRTIRLVKEGNTRGQDHTIVKVSARKKGLLLTLKAVTTREAAESLVGMEIHINRDQLPKLAADTWYWQDLKGLRIVDQTLGEIGTIDHIFSTGADDILAVKTIGDKTEVLIPMNRHFVDAVDLDQGVITTRLPEGLVPE